MKELSIDLSLKEIDNLKVHCLGKNGKLTSLLKLLHTLPKDKKVTVGKSLNIIK